MTDQKIGADGLAFGARLRLLIRSSHVPVKEVARRSGISESGLRDYYIRGRLPGSDNLCQLADFFGVTTDYLLGRTTVKNADALLRVVLRGNKGGSSDDR